MVDKMAKQILTVSELADHLSVHRITIYRLLKTGSIPGFKIGRVWRFELDQIASWMTTGIPPAEVLAAGAAPKDGPRPVRATPREQGRAQKRKKPPPGN
jgi:excisionase family DNA binding protein